MLAEQVWFGLSLLCAGVSAGCGYQALRVGKVVNSYRHQTEEELTVQGEVTAAGLRLMDTVERQKAETCTLFSQQDDGNSGAFNMSAFGDKYSLEQELPGGGMGRLFIVRNNRLGNRWVLKYIDRHNGGVIGEDGVLKLLNHIHLPQIVDIAHDSGGTYLVESYIEGVTLERLMQEVPIFGQGLAVTFGEQLAQVLKYLHTLAPHPIIHRDLKPSNIMVTHDNKPVVIDFGISRLLHEHIADKAGTLRYAAPEQLAGVTDSRIQGVIRERFGELPEAASLWSTDERADLYALGGILFEMCTGAAAKVNNLPLIDQRVSREFAAIIKKSLQTVPDDRYPSAEALLEDLARLKRSRDGLVKSLVARRVAAASAVLLICSAGASYAAGRYTSDQERGAILKVGSERMVLTAGQSAELEITKTLPNGRQTALSGDQIIWQTESGHVQVEGNRLKALDVGEAQLYGRYRNKTLEIRLTVQPARPDAVAVSLAYEEGWRVERHSGTAERRHTGGPVEQAEYVSPESMATLADGTLLLVDSGRLRRIQGGEVGEVHLEGVRARRVLAVGTDALVLTDPVENASGQQEYRILKVRGSAVQPIYNNSAEHSEILDWASSSSGEVYYIERTDNGAGGIDTLLKCVDARFAGSPRIVGALENGMDTLAVGDGRCFTAASETGYLSALDLSIHSPSPEVLMIPGEAKEMRDGTAPTALNPVRIRWYDGALYLLDWNVLRRVTLKDGRVVKAETLVGTVNADMKAVSVEGPGDAFALRHSQLADIAFAKDGILLSDPKGSRIWKAVRTRDSEPKRAR